MNRDTALEALGRILFEEMERLAPSSPDRISDWRKIKSWERRLYINCVERLCEERELIGSASEFTSDHAV